jgi:hypothetical protein
MTAKLAAKYTTTIATLRDQREAGAPGLEYAGMIAVAALVVALIWTAIDQGGVTESVKTAITDLFDAES